MTAPVDANALIEQLGLSRHPEGGWYRETFRSTETVHTARGLRATSTAIHFLLEASTFSAWHRVSSDEVWHLYGGGPAELHLFDGTQYRMVTLGTDRSLGQTPQFVVPAGVWQATSAPESAAWFGCTVAPGFDFADFELASSDWLDAHPAQRHLLEPFLR